MIRTFLSEREKHRCYNSLSEEQKYDAFCDILFESADLVFHDSIGKALDKI